ncbi:hypothetical protein D3C87_977030 [compost metagenome]
MLGQGPDHVDHLTIHQPKVPDVFLDAGVGDAIEHMVENRRAVAPEVAVGGPVATFGEDHVGTLLPLLDQQRNDVDRVLQVDIHGNHGIAAGVLQAGKQCRFLAEVAREIDQHDLIIRLRQCRSLFGRAVGAAIVDEHDLDFGAAQLQLPSHRLIKQVD